MLKLVLDSVLTGAVVIMSLLLLGCGGSTDSEELVGVWTLDLEASVPAATPPSRSELGERVWSEMRTNFVMTIEFGADGRFTYFAAWADEAQIREEGSWEFGCKTTIVLSWDDSEYDAAMGTCRLEDGYMLLGESDDTTMNAVFVRTD